MKEMKIPAEIFNNRELAVLESLVKYLKEELNMTYAEIATELNRDDRTIWTVYSRAKKKIKKTEEQKKKNNTYNVSKKEKQYLQCK